VIFPVLHLSNKRKEKEKKRNINNDLAVLPSYDIPSTRFIIEEFIDIVLQYCSRK